MTKKQNGITLVALIITIIILLILAGITISTITGKNGLLARAKQGKEETEKSTATETINLKITTAQINSYAEKGENATLQYLADKFCEDNDFQYVELQTKKIGTTHLPNITVGDNKSIFVKLNQYNYEFEIDSNLRLASIDGVKIADNNSTITTEQYESLLSEIKSMKENYDNLKEDYEKRISTLENETIVNKRVNLMNTVVSIPIKNSNVSVSDITLSDSLNNYKYLEFEYDCINGSDYFGNILEFISTNSIVYNNSNTVKWGNDSMYILSQNSGDVYGAFIDFWFKDDKTIHIHESGSNSGYSTLRIKNIYGIK